MFKMHRVTLHVPHDLVVAVIGELSPFLHLNKYSQPDWGGIQAAEKRNFGKAGQPNIYLNTTDFSRSNL